MSKDGNRPADTAELRRRAEKVLRRIRASTGRRSAEGDAEKLLNELSVHQIELEMVNEELRRANEEIEAGLARYTELYEFAPVGYLTLSRDGKILSANLTAVGLLGEDRSRLLNRSLQHCFSDGDVSTVSAFLRMLFRDGVKQVCEVTLPRKGDPPLFVRIEATISGAGQECRAVLADITEQKKNQERLRQSHKMEAIGHLAAGMAHDYNNLLTTIIGYADLIHRRLPPNNPARRMAGDIRKAGTRAAVLTRQLLAFSRKQTLVPKVLDLGVVVAGMEKMIRRLIGEDITLITDTEPGLWNVKADPAQVEQILLNLATNSRDAMPGGGSLRISTANVTLSDSFAQAHPPLAAGPFVSLTVRDTGCGMGKETLSHLFDPFFTTKEVGKGTGLGMASVYGAVKQSDAYIDVASELGKGTSVGVYFPKAIGKEETIEAPKGSLESLRGTETLLVVEDDEFVLDLVKNILGEHGYTVLVAGSGAEAMKILKKKGAGIDLILTDIVMPQMSGHKLALRAARLFPEVRILFMSGYPRIESEKEGMLPPDATYIKKPFSPMDLARIVREALDSPPAARQP